MKIETRPRGLNKVELAVATELSNAMNAHAPMASLHEAYAVILEEVDELWDEVRKKAKNRKDKHVAQELIQISAMCIRALVDLGYWTKV